MLERATSALEAIGANPYSERDQERADKDLQAQSEMALWALCMAIIAGIQAILTAIGILYIYKTLKATRLTIKIAARSNRVASKANDVASEANAAAREAIKVTEWAAKRELRAYLAVTPVGVEWDRANSRIHAVIRHFNSGATPALNVHAHTEIVFLSYPLPDDFEFSAVGTPESLSIIHSQGDTVINPAWDGDANPRFLKGAVTINELRMHVYSVLRYEDVFGCPHETHACWAFTLTDELINAAANKVVFPKWNHAKRYNSLT